jgi:hypothetical protein
MFSSTPVGFVGGTICPEPLVEIMIFAATGLSGP